MSKRIRDPKFEACARCGYTREGHALANYADGAFVGATVLVCPFATWKSPLTVNAVDPSATSTGKLSTRAKKSSSAGAHSTDPAPPPEAPRGP